MKITIKLNENKYRYDIFQMFNIFYGFKHIEFSDENFDFSIDISNELVKCKFESMEEDYKINNLKEIKEQVKLAVFTFLTNITKQFMPWGTLVGIRPSKIALNLINSGKNDREIIEYFYSNYKTAENKAKLCIDVAKVEREKVNLDNKLISIYIGMPFCPTRCLYCSFASNSIASCSKLVPEYLDALMLEINKVSHYISEKELKIQCVYFGGGTPTSVSDQQFKTIMDHIYNSFIKNNNVEEFTVECGRPDSITEDKLITMKKYNVHRISINPQSMNDKTLKLIGRNHSVKDIIDKFNLARKLGFDNINMDIIVGLPGEGIEEIERTCSSIYELNPDNITIHGLSIKRASRLYEDIINKKNYSIAAHEDLIKMYNRTALLAEDLKMKPYYMYRQKNMVGNMENIGYCKEGKEGIYNIQMIEDKQTIIACGADAVTKAVYPGSSKIERTTNVKDLREYIKRVEEMINKKIELLNNIY